MRDERKLFLFVILLVAIPSIILSIFAIHALVGQRILIQKKIKESYSVLASNTIRRIQEEMSQQEKVIKNFVLNRHQPEERIDMTNFPLLNSLVSRVFFIDPTYKITYPQARPTAPGKKIDITENYSKFAEAFELEYQHGKYQQAIAEYERIVAEEREQNSQSQGEALVGIARCYRKLQKYQLAEKTYRDLLQLFQENETSQLAYILAARSELIQLQVHQQKFYEALQNALDFLEEVTYNEHRLASAQYQFYYQKTTGLIQELLRNSSLSEESRVAFEEIYQQVLTSHKQQQEKEQLLARTQEEVLPLLRARQGENSGYLTYYNKQQRKLIYFLEIPEIPENLGYVLCEINLSYCLNSVILPILENQEAGKDIFLTLVDQDLSPVLGKISEQFTPLLATSLEPVFPFWQVAVYLKDIHSLEDLSRHESYLYFGGVVIVILILFGGMCALVTTFVRGVQNARLKSDFVSNVTHELKTPLTAIKMFVETLLMERTTSKEEQQECLQIISAESDRLSRLIDRILDFAKMEQKKRSFYFEWEDIGKVVEETVAQFRNQVPEHDCKLTLEIQDNLPLVWLDREAFSEAVTNLLSNAYKYIDHREKEIEVRCIARKNSIRVAIKDNGIGIPRQEFQRIFQKFYRVENSLTRPIEGTGLGLSLVASIIDAHEGQIKVSSKVGVGSEFVIRLPIKETTGKTVVG